MFTMLMVFNKFQFHKVLRCLQMLLCSKTLGNKINFAIIVLLFVKKAIQYLSLLVYRMCKESPNTAQDASEDFCTIFLATGFRMLNVVVQLAQLQKPFSTRKWEQTLKYYELLIFFKYSIDTRCGIVAQQVALLNISPVSS